MPLDSVQWLKGETSKVRRQAWCRSLDEHYRIVRRAPGVKTRTVERDLNFDPSQVGEFDTDDQSATKARTSRQDLGKVSIKYSLILCIYFK